jgi:hypothetical protein
MRSARVIYAHIMHRRCYVRFTAAGCSDLRTHTEGAALPAAPCSRPASFTGYARFLAEDFLAATLATLRPLAAGSAHRNPHLAPQAAATKPPLRHPAQTGNAPVTAICATNEWRMTLDGPLVFDAAGMSPHAPMFPWVSMP